MKKIYLVLAIFVVPFFTGCSNQEEQEEFVGRTVTFETAYDPQTRTLMKENGAFKWTGKETFSVNGVASAENSATISSDSTTIRFSVTAKDAKDALALVPPYYVLLNSNYDWGYANGKYHLWADSQRGTEVPEGYVIGEGGKYGYDSNPAVAIAETEADKDHLEFKNIYGVLKATLVMTKSVDIRYVFLFNHNVVYQSNGSVLSGYRKGAGEKITGDFALDCRSLLMEALDSGKIGDEMGVLPSSHNAWTILQLPNVKTFAAGETLVVYFLLPPNTYAAGWKIQVCNGSRAAVGSATATGNLTITRAKITDAGFVTIK